MSPLIPAGGKVAVIAPSGAFNEERFHLGLDIARRHGLELEPLPDLLRPQRYLAAPDPHRCAQLVEALTSPHYAAVWAARGGFGVTRLLEHLPWDKLPPRPLIGFSDLTPLLDALARRVNSPTVHGPVVHSLPQTDDASIEHLAALLAGRPTAPLQGEQWVDGTASGPLVGGNLALLAATCGTPFQLRADGALLLLEDVGEPGFRIDRMLQQLASAGILQSCAGFAIGSFTNCTDGGEEWSVRDVLLDHLGELGVPVVAGLPIGHGAQNFAFRVHHPAQLHGGQLHLGPSR